eukprot:TRINITY_DN7373_c0_g1_i2.p1 TRINITY_DN7373_c0_g1~~TRINITY_DN7373_c0_g1_i2.p1  ORF type:complete len:2651 (-),score=193.72 TRINITY_DN7373_c0_g1_i2:118-6912(-)
MPAAPSCVSKGPLRMIKTAGEALTWVVVRECCAFAPRAALCNFYGPTETTVDQSANGPSLRHPLSMASELNAVGGPPIGFPLRWRLLHVSSSLIVDGADRDVNCDVPTDTAGELRCAGVGLCDGYLNADVKQKTSFMDCPLAAGMQYRTGDLVRWTSPWRGTGQPTLLHLGRIDRQIKLHGVRIEPAEIEAVISKVYGVTSALVVPKRSENISRPYELCAFVRPATVSKDLVLQSCREQLPLGMVPSTVVCLDEWPLLSSGKTDTKRLLEITCSVPSSHQEPAATTSKCPTHGAECTEENDSVNILPWLGAIRSAVLELMPDNGARQSLLNDSPLLDAGLGSLGSIRLAARLSRLVDVEGTAISATDVFGHPTIEGLARFVAERFAAPVIHHDEALRIPGPSSDDPSLLLVKNTSPSKPALADVVSFSSRFPARLTDLLLGVETATEVPLERFDIDEYCLPRAPHITGQSIKLHSEDETASSIKSKAFTRFGCFVHGASCFDAAAFRISREQAVGMDPQQRIALEESYAALLPVVRTFTNPRHVAVAVGLTNSEWGLKTGESDAAVDYTDRLGVASLMAGRISYALNFVGPSLVVDTACSSAMVALDMLAHRYLHHPECDAGLLLGVKLILHSSNLVLSSALGILSPDGRCYAFDARANGTLAGEGCGAAVLRPHIGRADSQAVVLGTSVLSGGRSASLTSPNGSAQAKNIMAAVRDAGLGKGGTHEIDLVECHATGTRLGDPIELAGLSSAISSSSSNVFSDAVTLSAVKPNLGHPDGAAGMASLLKTIHHCFQSRVIPCMLHLRILNPHGLAHTALFSAVVEPSAVFPKTNIGAAPCGLVAAFGMSGTNTHGILAPAELRASNTIRGFDFRRQRFEWRKPLKDLTYCVRWQSISLECNGMPTVGSEEEDCRSLQQAFWLSPPLDMLSEHIRRRIHEPVHERVYDGLESRSPPEDDLDLLARRIRGASDDGVPLVLCLQGVMGPDRCENARGSALVSMARSARLEGYRVQCVDLSESSWHIARSIGDGAAADITNPRNQLRSSSPETVAVVHAMQANEPDVVVRGADVLAPRLCRMQAASVSTVQPIASQWMITGGLGGLGMLAAEEIARAGRATKVPTTVIAVTRSGRASSGQLAAQLLENIRQLCGSFEIVKEDVANLSSPLLSRVRGFHVIHAAGMAHSCELALLDRPEITNALNAKAWGLFNILRAMRDSPYVISFNSASSILGLARGAAYAAANGYADGLLRFFNEWESRDTSLPKCVALQWSGVGEIGMAMQVRTSNGATRAPSSMLLHLAQVRAVLRVVTSFPQAASLTPCALISSPPSLLAAGKVLNSRFLSNLNLSVSNVTDTCRVMPRRPMEPQIVTSAWARGVLAEAVEAALGEQAGTGALGGSLEEMIESLDSLDALVVQHRVQNLTGVTVPSSSLCSGLGEAIHALTSAAQRFAMKSSECRGATAKNVSSSELAADAAASIPIDSAQEQGLAPRYLHLTVAKNTSRVLFLHGLAADGALVTDLLKLTGWAERLGHGVCFACPDGPHITRGRDHEPAYAALASRGLYDASKKRWRSWGLFRILGLDSSLGADDWFSEAAALLREELSVDPMAATGASEAIAKAALAEWEDAKRGLARLWAECGPFDAIAGICEGAAVALELCLDPSSPLQPPPRRLLQFGGFRAARARTVDAGNAQPGCAAARAGFKSLHVRGHDTPQLAYLFDEVVQAFQLMSTERDAVKVLQHTGAGRGLPLPTPELQAELESFLVDGLRHMVLGAAQASSTLAKGDVERNAAATTTTRSTVAAPPGLPRQDQALAATLGTECVAALTDKADEKNFSETCFERTRQAMMTCLAECRVDKGLSALEAHAMSSSTTFADVGLNSLDWLLMRERLKSMLAVSDIPPYLIYLCPNIDQLIKKICTIVNGGDAGQPVRPIVRLAQQPDAMICLPAHQISPTAQVGNDVTFEGPVQIGARSVVEGEITFGIGCIIGCDVRIRGNIKVGKHCVIEDGVALKGSVVLGDDCYVGDNCHFNGPIVVGMRTRFEVGCVVGVVVESKCGSIQIGDDCTFHAGAKVLHPRGRLLPSWRPLDANEQASVMASEEAIPNLTRVGNRVSCSNVVCHDLHIEDDVELAGSVAGYCRLSRGCKVGMGSTLHQFTTLGEGSIVFMGETLRADLLPFTLQLEGQCIVDTVSLRRRGLLIQDIDALRCFYATHFSQPASTYTLEWSASFDADASGRWFDGILRRFFEARRGQRDIRPIRLVSAAKVVED